MFILKLSVSAISLQMSFALRGGIATDSTPTTIFQHNEEGIDIVAAESVREKRGFLEDFYDDVKEDVEDAKEGVDNFVEDAPAVIGGLIEDAPGVSSLNCIANDISAAFSVCCPSEDTSDPICKALWNFAVISDDFTSKAYGRCECGELQDTCENVVPLVAPVALIVPLAKDFQQACSQVDNCCNDGETTNREFGKCMGDAIERGDITISDDFDDLLGGIIPDDLEDAPVVETLKCIASDITKTFTECCTEESASPICAILSCSVDIDDKGIPTIKNECTCVEVEDMCNEFVPIINVAASTFPELFEDCAQAKGMDSFICNVGNLFIDFLDGVCSSVGGCCTDGTDSEFNVCGIENEGSVTTNTEFGNCMVKAVDNGDIKLPDIRSLKNSIDLPSPAPTIALPTPNSATSKPTSDPTMSPTTSKPTSNPTMNQTMRPSTAPSFSPIKSLTSSPSMGPTIKPSSEPVGVSSIITAGVDTVEDIDSDYATTGASNVGPSASIPADSGRNKNKESSTSDAKGGNVNSLVCIIGLSFAFAMVRI